jgi:hypothetical protein
MDEDLDAEAPAIPEERSVLEYLRGASSKSHDTTVRNYFREFFGVELSSLQVNQENPDEIRALKDKYEAFALKMVEKFRNSADRKPAWQTTMNYLSALQNVIRDIYFAGEMGIFSETKWYNDVRRTTTKLYIKACSELGVKLVNSPDPLTEEILALICDSFLAKNSSEFEKSRALLCLMWHLFGRVSEIGNLRTHFISFDVNYGCLTIDMIRTKGATVNRQSNYGIFLNNGSWKYCPIHALGSHFILNPPLENSDFCFNGIHKDRMSAYVKRFLDEFLKKAPESLKNQLITPHSFRHGGAQKSNADPKVSLSWIIERGEWVMDRVNTAFEYIIGGASTNDRKVGRSLSKAMGRFQYLMAQPYPVYPSQPGS